MEHEPTAFRIWGFQWRICKPAFTCSSLLPSSDLSQPFTPSQSVTNTSPNLQASCPTTSNEYCCDNGALLGLECILSSILGNTCSQQTICCVDNGGVSLPSPCCIKTFLLIPCTCRSRAAARLMALPSISPSISVTSCKPCSSMRNSRSWTVAQQVHSEVYRGVVPLRELQVRGFYRNVLFLWIWT